MARRLSTVTDEIRTTNTGAIPSAWPLTMAVTVKKLATEAQRMIVNIGHAGINTEWLAILVAIGGEYSFITYNGGSLSILTAPTVSPVGLHTLVARWTNNTTRELFIDGVSVAGGSGQPSINPPPTLARFSVGYGVRALGYNSSEYHEVGEAAMWTSAISNDEILAYTRGITPNRIRPDKLKLYWPLYGHSPEPDLSGSGMNSILISGTSVVDHLSVGRYAPYPIYRYQEYQSIPIISEEGYILQATNHQLYIPSVRNELLQMPTVRNELLQMPHVTKETIIV